MQTKLLLREIEGNITNTTVLAILHKSLSGFYFIFIIFKKIQIYIKIRSLLINHEMKNLR